jgi:hypothetical protein
MEDVCQSFYVPLCCACQLCFSKKTVGNIFCTFFRADGVLGAAIAGAGMVVVGGTVLALAGAAALVGMVVKKK